MLIEEITSNAANGDDHDSTSNTEQHSQNILRKRFNQRVVGSTQSKIDSV